LQFILKKSPERIQNLGDLRNLLVEPVAPSA
jgi:hypothetical protein